MNKLIDKFGKKAVIIAIVSLSIAVVFALTGVILMIVGGLNGPHNGGGSSRGYDSSLSLIAEDTEYATYDTEEAFNFYTYANKYLLEVSDYYDTISVIAYSADGTVVSGTYSSYYGGYILYLTQYERYTIRIKVYSTAVPYDYMISEI